MADAEKKPDNNEEESKDAGTEGAAQEQAQSGGGKTKLILMILGPLLLLAIVGGVLYFLGVFGGAHDEEQAAQEPVEMSLSEQLDGLVVYELPPMLINLRATGRRTSFLKLKVNLEVEGNEETKKEMDQVKMRLVDQFQTYLRELQVDDLQGSAGLQRLREELLDRVNATTNPIQVKNVLFAELLVQ